MADNTENKAMDWDDEITDDGEYSGEESVILPDGNYPFEVIKTEQVWYDGSEKLQGLYQRTRRRGRTFPYDGRAERVQRVPAPYAGTEPESPEYTGTDFCSGPVH